MLKETVAWFHQVMGHTGPCITLHERETLFYACEEQMRFESKCVLSTLSRFRAADGINPSGRRLRLLDRQSPQ